MATSTIHTSGRIFWHKIRGGKTCTPPQTNSRRKLQIHGRVGRHKIHRYHTRLGLQMDKIASVTDRIHRQNTQRKFQIHGRVGRKKVHWNHTRLRLQMQTSASVTDRIHQQIFQTFQPHKKEKQHHPYPSAPIIYGAKNNMKLNHLQRHCLTKREINLFNKYTESFYF